VSYVVISLSGCEFIDQAFFSAVTAKTALKIVSLNPPFMMRFLTECEAALHFVTWEI
jgi:hypothetical protein